MGLLGLEKEELLRLEIPQPATTPRELGRGVRKSFWTGQNQREEACLSGLAAPLLWTISEEF